MPISCEVCGTRQARYVCSECGRRVCPFCFDPYVGLCTFCLREVQAVDKVEEDKTVLDRWVRAGFLLVFIGITLTFLGVLLMAFSGGLGREISGGIVIIPFIPIPLGIGFGPYGWLLTVLAFILAVILLVLTLIYWRKLLFQ